MIRRDLLTAATAVRPSGATTALALRAVPELDTSVRSDAATARAAHLVRRTSLAVDPRRIDELAALDWHDAIDNVIDHAVSQPVEPSPNNDDDWARTIQWWLEQMMAPTSGLLDKMAWFWHGLLTTNVNKVDGDLLGPQLDLIRRQALGNYRSLLHAFVIDGALLQYLDGDRSPAFNPNENLARELMELFTIGRGNYTQDDVRAAARALAGWRVEDGVVSFDRRASFNGPLIFLGEQNDWDTERVVDALCDHPATAQRVSARLWRHLVGTHLTEEGAVELGKRWQEMDLEIVPLVEHILKSAAFESTRLARPRTGLEWWCAALSATEIRRIGNVWTLNDLGQMPFRPPNVAGWPDDDRWLEAGSMLNRATQLWSIDAWDVFGEDPTPTEDILRRCALHEVSDASMAAIDGSASETGLSVEAQHHLRWRLALSTPEFNLI